MKDLIVRRNISQKATDYQHYSFHKQAQIQNEYTKYMKQVSEKYGASRPFKQVLIPSLPNIMNGKDDQIAKVRLYTNESTFNDMENDQVDQINY